MAKRTPFTAQQERLERRLKNLERELAATRTMVDPARGVLSAQLIKVDDPVSPQIIRVSEGGSLEVGGASSWRRIDMLTEAVSHTGDLIETELHKAVLPADSMGPNGAVRISSIWRTTVGGGGTYWNRIKFGGTTIARFAHTALLAVDSRQIEVWNKGNAGAQSHVQNTMLLHTHVGNSTIIDITKDTTQDVDIEFTAQCGNAAHVVTLYFAMVEVIYRD